MNSLLGVWLWVLGMAMMYFAMSGQGTLCLISGVLTSATLIAASNNE